MNDLESRLIQNYNYSLDYAGVKGSRLAKRFGLISEIGQTPEGGSRRLGYSREERQAKELVKKWMREAGLSVREDEAGNVFGRMEGRHTQHASILSGSHLDTVPNGGHFDGVLGVLAALEVAESWKQIGFQPDIPYEIVIFSDEEGSRFNTGLTGSKAVVGDLDWEMLSSLSDLEGTSFEKVLEQDGLDFTKLAATKWDFESIHAFIEVHIEQGKQLEKGNQPVGIVSGIAGPCWLKFIFEGVAGHAGNTPMDDRQDALLAASKFILEVNSLPEQVSESAVATVGKLEVDPNGVNVIPGRVELHVDIRDIKEDTRDLLIEKTKARAANIANHYSVKVESAITHRVAPVPVNERLKEKLMTAAGQNGLEQKLLPSGAGHDAMIIGRYVPMGMLFVRSANGTSHNPKEWSSLNDCVTAVHVLKQSIESMQ
ncbi:M20 family metallo-hydrolase [Thalassobacillus pellis]|uniref:M20 family metallo-hydrolase n=1 Tax=Thalassobacillus pellis TaxID=748008 RepID=UPI001960CEA6|nr:M20 family metallo-hydrolase [Thalassobacillus pellis]MBM7551481.1 allantoate deiminase [Thalassobacillus pellis]